MGIALKLKLDRALVLVCCVSLVGCTTMTPVGPSGLAARGASGDDPLPRVTEGDTVTIALKGGRKLEGRLEKVDFQSVQIRHGSGQELETLQIDQIVSVDRRAFSPIKTVLLVAGVALVLYAYAYSKALATLLGNR
jgi:hypothetical protein